MNPFAQRLQWPDRSIRWPNPRSDRPWWDVHLRRFDGLDLSHAFHLDIESRKWAHGDALFTNEEAMAFLDDTVPLPCPPPMCGQVWVSTLPATEVGGGWSGLVTDVDIRGWTDDGPYLWWIMMGRHHMLVGAHPEADHHWPRPNTVLVSGPGAPWGRT